MGRRILRPRRSSRVGHVGRPRLPPGARRPPPPPAPADPPGGGRSVAPAFLPALAARLPNRFPSILDLPMDPSQCWAGLYPETPDHHALIGEGPAGRGLSPSVGARG